MPIFEAPGDGDRLEIPPGAGPGHKLPIVFDTQKPNANWCWAACCVMVFKYLGLKNPDNTDITKCQLASWAFSPSDCCKDPLSGPCDNGLWPNGVYDHFGVRLSPTVPPDSSVTFTLEQIKDEVGTNRRPIEPYLRWTNGGGHVVLVGGWSDDDLLWVLDPWFGEKWINHTELGQAYSFGQWAGTYHGFSRA